jgi:large subunit ribosomal protein L13
VTNASRIYVTGKKMEDKKYYKYSGYPGGLRETNLKAMLEKHPERVIELAVKRMLPKNRLGRKIVKKLKVYAGDEHPHKAQQPEKIDL